MITKYNCFPFVIQATNTHRYRWTVDLFVLRTDVLDGVKRREGSKRRKVLLLQNERDPKHAEPNKDGRSGNRIREAAHILKWIILLAGVTRTYMLRRDWKYNVLIAKDEQGEEAAWQRKGSRKEAEQTCVWKRELQSAGNINNEGGLSPRVSSLNILWP